MIQKNRNFEEFMNFRDMIQGDALNDRIKMVQSMSEKPVMAMARGGSIEDQEEDNRIAKVGDSLAEVYVEAAQAKNPDMFKKFYKQQARISEGADLVAGGLASMPVVEASFGGFLEDFAKNAAINVGKSILGDIAGEAVGGIAESISPAVADALGSTAGKAIFGAGANALMDYGLSEVFDYGAGPNIIDFGTDVALRGFADYMATPEDERAVFGELFLDEEDADEARKIAAIRKARLLQASERESDFITERTKAFREAEKNMQNLTGAAVKPSTVFVPPQKDFLSRVADYARLDEAVKDPISTPGLRQIGLRSLDPLGKAALQTALAVPEGQQAQPQGVQSIQPSKFVPRLSREVGGLRGITVPANVDRSELNQRQVTELGTKGFTIHKGKRITKQDLVGRTEFARRTKPIATAAEGGPITNEEFVMSLMYPDQFSGMVGGDGHGMEDNVQMPIVSDGEQVATLAVSPKEYVVDAYTMSALGNGNADEGAKIMDETIKSIRRKAYGTNKQPNEINGSKALRSGLRSIA
mgnify:CR=1 FL=1